MGRDGAGRGGNDDLGFCSALGPSEFRRSLDDASLPAPHTKGGTAQPLMGGANWGAGVLGLDMEGSTTETPAFPDSKTPLHDAPSA